MYKDSLRVFLIILFDFEYIIENVIVEKVLFV